MAPVTIKMKSSAEAMGENMSSELGFLNLIEHHRKIFLSTPFILAAILGVLYVFGPSELRRVLDFMSPGHLFGH